MNRTLLTAALWAVAACAVAAETTTPTTLATPDTVLASRGDAELLVADIDAFVATVPPRDRAMVVTSEERVTTLLQNLLMNRQLANEARAAGLDRDPKVQREVLLATEKVLARHGLTLHVERQPIGNLEQLAKETYLAEQSRFVAPESRTVRHILVSTRERSSTEAQALVERIAAEARQPGADFAALVQKYSEDPGKSQNQGIYLVDASVEAQMDPAFVMGARELTEVGQLSGPVPGMYGIHLIRLEQYQPQRQLSFAEVSASLMASLREAQVKRIEDEHMAALRAQNPEIVTEVAEGLKTRYLQTPAAAAGR